MPLLTAGVSVGVAVTAQNTGVTLSTVDDYGVIPVSNAAPGQGPDSQGVLTLSGVYGVSAVIAIEKAVSPADLAAANWTPYLGAITRSTGASLSSYLVTLLANTAVDITLPTIQGFTAVRARLVTVPTSGAVVVSGSTYPAATGALSASETAMFAQLALIGQAQVLALSDMNGVDYMAAVGGSF